MNFHIENKISLEATFRIEKFKEDGTVTYQGPEFRNLVLNNGLYQLHTNSVAAMIAYVNIGNGTTAPEITQTALQNRLYSTSTVFTNGSYGGYSHDPDFLFFRKIFQFDIGTCTGSFTELGLSKASNSNYFNRQLIKDAQGNPITLTCAADEGMRITVEVRLSHSASSRDEVLKLDLKGATSGGVTFSNGTTSKAIDITVMNAASALNQAVYTTSNTNGSSVQPYHQTSFRDSLDDIFGGAGTIRSIFKQEDGTFLIHFPPSRTTPSGLVITGNTLVGNSSAPTIETFTPFTGPLQGTFTHTNESTTQTETKNYISYCYWRTVTTGDDQRGAGCWGCFFISGFGSFNMIWSLAMDFDIAITGVGSYTSNTKVTSPVLDPLSLKVSRTFYWAPGVLGAGVKTFDTISIGYTGVIIISPGFSISDTEEFSITLSMTWGRYIP